VEPAGESVFGLEHFQPAAGAGVANSGSTPKLWLCSPHLKLSWKAPSNWRPMSWAPQNRTGNQKKLGLNPRMRHGKINATAYRFENFGSPFELS
jgi:hypothetical protein